MSCFNLSLIYQLKQNIYHQPAKFYGISTKETVSFVKLTFGVLQLEDNTWPRVEYTFERFTWHLTNERSEQVRLRAEIGETGSCVYNCDNQSYLHIYLRNENM